MYASDYNPEYIGRLMHEGPNAKDIEDLSARSTKENPLVTPEFPEELKTLPVEPVLVSGPNCTWFKPANLGQLNAIRAKSGKDAQLISGATDLNFKRVYHPDLSWPLLVSTEDIVELRQIKIRPDNSGVDFGAGVSINEISQFWDHEAPASQQLLGTTFTTITKHFANYNIRNIGTIGGSVCAGDALSDLCPIIMATNGICHVISQNGQRDIPAADFITKKDFLQPNEILLSVFIPFVGENDFVRSWKICKRREDSQATTNGCFNVHIEGGKVTKASIAIGAVSAKPFLAIDACKAIIGRPWDFSLFEDLLKGIFDHLEISQRVGQVELRKDLIKAMTYKFYIWVTKKLGIPVKEEISCADEPFKRKVRSDKQDWTQRQENVVGQQPPHVSAIGHTTGEAKFVGDITPPQGCLFAAPVQSTKCSCSVVSIDPSEALAMKGVVAFISKKDIVGVTQISSIPPADEDVFASDYVHVYGQIMGLIIAESEHIAHKAARKVKVTYGEQKPIIITVQQAMEAAKTDKSLYLVEKMGLTRGHPESTEAEIEVKGQSYINNQEHFYLETNSMLVVPLGTEGYKVYAACQNPTKIQESVAAVLGLPRNNVVCEVMRLGGGFGGKQDRPQFYAAQAAVACHKLGRPIRYVLQRMEDIQTAGMRHEYLTDYRLGADKDGMIKYFDAHYHSNGGISMDLSQLVMDRTVYSATGGYYSPNTAAIGTIYRTNKLSCTAFRGFGVPQSLLTIETAMAHLAYTMGVRPEVIKEKNLYHAHDRTLTGYELPDDNTRRTWFACKESCDWDRQVQEVEAFNKTHVYKKRGISMVPVVSTMGFESEFMMKGGSLVQIFGDGSVTVAHGGLEMGQGIHVKMQMIAAQTLGIPIEKVKVVPTTTEKTCNTPPTAGSTGTDLQGGAVFRACQELNERIQPIRDAHPDWTWEQICSYGFFNKLDMQASGFNKMPNSVYDHHTGKGRESYYLIWSVAFVLVELDVLTGEHVVLRTDIVHDCGSSINPAIDIGQLEGGFVQGEGLFTLEEHIWDKRDGHLRTRNVTTYKVPTLDDMPDDFRVQLLKNNYNDMGVYGSKASGEAGLRLGCAVLTALRDAIQAARVQFGVDEWFELHSPATQEQIRSLIPVKFQNPAK